MRGSPRLSNNLLYSAMVVYAIAMCSFAAELAFWGRRSSPVTVRADERELATVGAGTAIGARRTPSRSTPPGDR